MVADSISDHAVSSFACQVVNLDSVVESESCANNKGPVKTLTRKITGHIKKQDEAPRAMIGHDETIFAQQQLYKRN